MSVIFQDRMGKRKHLEYYTGETLESLLTRYHIPVLFRYQYDREVPICENTIIENTRDYVIKLIEGYDIESIISNVFSQEPISANYVKNRVTFAVDGSLMTEHVPMTCEEVVQMGRGEYPICYSKLQLKLIRGIPFWLVCLVGWTVLLC